MKDIVAIFLLVFCGDQTQDLLSSDRAEVRDFKFYQHGVFCIFFANITKFEPTCKYFQQKVVDLYIMIVCYNLGDINVVDSRG